MLVVNSVYPAIARTSSSVVQISDVMGDRIKTQVSIVYATGELNSGGSWVDTDSDGYFDVTVWVKNVGSSRILDPSQVDVFFGQEGSFARIPYVDDASGYPRWSYTLENGTEWSGTVTMRINIHYSSTQSSGTYIVKVVTPSSAADELTFSF